jgi:hypothetical protein
MVYLVVVRNCYKKHLTPVGKKKPPTELESILAGGSLWVSVGEAIRFSDHDVKTSSEEAVLRICVDQGVPP